MTDSHLSGFPVMDGDAGSGLPAESDTDLPLTPEHDGTGGVTGDNRDAAYSFRATMGTLSNPSVYIKSLMLLNINIQLINNYVCVECVAIEKI